MRTQAFSIGRPRSQSPMAAQGDRPRRGDPAGAPELSFRRRSLPFRIGAEPVVGRSWSRSHVPWGSSPASRDSPLPAAAFQKLAPRKTPGPLPRRAESL